MKRSLFSFLSCACVLFILTGTACGAGGSAPKEQLPVTGPDVPGAAAYDKAILGLLQKYNIPGAAVAVTKDGKLILARGYGYADVESKTPVQPDALFRIASLSKPITAAAILHLAEQGKLNLDAKFLDILTEFTPPANADARLRSVTVRHLLEHAGGWNRDVSGDPMFMSIKIADSLGAPAPATCRNIIQYMLGQPLDFAPGTNYAYSNFGYCILGRVIEKVSGQPYEIYVRDNVLAPMGVHAMRTGKTLADGRAPGEVKYYDYPGAPLAPSVFPSITTKVPMQYGGFYLEAMDSHGAWIGSAVDLTRFMTALEGRRGTAFLSSTSLIEMTARPDVPAWSTSASWYGLGLFIRPQVVDANWWHTGALAGEVSLLVRSYNGYSWAALMNSRTKDGAGIGGDLDKAMWTALGAGLQGSPTDLYAQFPSANLPPSQGSARAAGISAKEH